MNRENIEAVYKLSAMQEGILYHYLLSPGTGSYVEQSNFSLEADVDVALFGKAWDQVMARHDVLRTSFVWENLDQPVQVVHRRCDIEIEQLDWSHLSEQEQEAVGGEFLRQDRLRSFDLSKLPLQRVRLVRLGSGKFRVLWTYHHILMDGWSADLVSNEVRASYRFHHQGKDFKLPKPIPYRVYIQWLARQDLAAAEHFWRSKLAGFKAPNRFGIARPALSDGAEAYAQEKHLLPMGLVSALKNKARQNQLTLYILVQAAWSILLSRYSSERMVVFGSTTAGRTLPIEGVDKMVGVFINTIAVPVQVAPDRVLSAWLRDQQHKHLRASAFEHTPLQKVHSWSEVPGNQPLFESILVYENYLGGVATSKRKASTEFTSDTTTNYPLTFLVYPGIDMYFRMLFDVRHFNNTVIRAMMGHMEELLRGMAEDLDRPISCLNLISAEERRQLFQTWNSTTPTYPKQADMGDLLEQAVSREPSRTAIRFMNQNRQETRLDYLEYDRRVRMLAGQLRLLGVGPDHLVGVFTQRDSNLVILLAAILRTGAGYLPLDPHLPDERIAFMVKDAAPGLVLTQSMLAKRLSGLGPRVLCLNEAGAIEDLPSTAATLGERMPVPEGVAYMLYTSGSTGKPKGVIVTHGNLVIFMHAMRSTLGFNPDDIWFGLTTFTFDISVLEWFLPLVTGAQLVYTDKLLVVDDRALIQLIEETQATWMQATPATWRMLIAGGWKGHPELNLISGGEALSYDLSRQLQERGKRLWNNYGPTEATIYALNRAIDKLQPEQEIGATEPLGPATGNGELYVLDPHMNLQPQWVSGEIYLGGLLLARGYHGRAGLTAERFVPDPYSGRASSRLYRTGDLGRILPDHRLEFLGRADDQVKLRGFRIELGEIDATLALFPALEQAATVLREVRTGESLLVSYVAARPGQTLDSDQLRVFLARSLPDYMIPSIFAILERLPLTASGKIDRKALPDPSSGIRLNLKDHQPPGNEVEVRLAAIWKDLLGLEQVGVEDNFFDSGGHSLRLVQLRGRIQTEFQVQIQMTDLFQYTSIRAQARFLAPETDLVQAEIPAEADAKPDETTTESGSAEVSIAVIGMACRFPGADDLDQFWSNIRNGVESISFFNDEDLLEAGIKQAWLDKPHYVKARASLEHIDLFDAAFFGINPREAEITDPQHRLFLEGAWQALEHSGTDPGRFSGRIGVFGGAGINTYAFENLVSNPDAIQGLSWHQLILANDASFMTTRISYKLDLKGPSVCIQTACSTSLVAIVQGCESLSAGRCDMVLAGGVAVTARQKTGYFYEEGGIVSSDGHCRPFDAESKGTVFGSGMGIVVLSRLADARAMGKHVYAVIRGYALNNDGSNKAGYTAPGVDGQTHVIREAQVTGRIDPATIGYVEAHGTGTQLGDPIEVTALSLAFRQATSETGFCALGSVKANIGHMDTAAGVAGFIKMVLALRHTSLPPLLHFNRPNPALDLENSPFYVNTKLEAWPPGRRGAPRRGAVSSFGIGGTNVHVILEEAPPRPTMENLEGKPQLLMFSARNAAALAQKCVDLEICFRERTELDLAAVAYTLQVGRKAFEHRAFLVSSSLAEASERLREQRLNKDVAHQTERPIILMFTGQGSQHPGMADACYRHQPEFRRVFDHCAQSLKPRLGLDLSELLYSDQPATDELARQLEHTAITQPALFAVEYALARMCLSWGVKVEAMIGHSVGEYVAACLAGVFNLDEALMLVAERGRLMQAQPVGAMLAVALDEVRLVERLRDGLELAAVNGPGRCTVAGTVEAIERLERELTAEGLFCTRLATSHAYHCALMEGAVAPFEAILNRLVLRPPQLPFISCLTGTWITSSQATDPAYWSAHLRRTVRFSDGLSQVFKDPNRILLELGPGETLATLARRHPERGPGHTLASALPKRREQDQDAFLLENLGALFLAGARLDWAAINSHQQGQIVDLPLYPFQRQRFWVEKQKDRRSRNRHGRKNEWFYLPGWKQTLMPASTTAPKHGWILFGGTGPFSQTLLDALKAAGQKVVEVHAGKDFRRGADRYVIRADETQDYEHLFRCLAEDNLIFDKLCFTWALEPQATEHKSAGDPALELGFFAPMYLARALARLQQPVRLALLSAGACQVESCDPIKPEQALLLGPARVIVREYPQVRCAALDLVCDGSRHNLKVATRIIAELSDEHFGLEEQVIAFRGSRRLVPAYERVALTRPEPEQRALVENGVYLITGGLGGIGLVLARHLVEKVHARVLLTSRSVFPEREAWPEWLASHDHGDPISTRIRLLDALCQAGAEIWIAQADVTDAEVLKDLIARLTERWGRLDGVIHAAGLAGGGLIELKTPEAARRVIAPKLQGTLALAEAIAPLKPGFLMLCSSMSAILGELGQVDYCAANAFLDAFAERGLPDTRVISVNWGAWREVGMAVDTQLPEALRKARELSLKKAISPEKGAEAFDRILASGQSRLVVSSSDLEYVMEQNAAFNADRMASGPAVPEASSAPAHPRPHLASVFVAPRDVQEQRIAEIWQGQIGIDRVGVDDNFFELGGDSLMGLQVVALINRAFESSLTAAGLYEAPTVAAVARLISGDRSESGVFGGETKRGSSRKEKIRSIKEKANRGNAHAKL